MACYTPFDAINGVNKRYCNSLQYLGILVHKLAYFGLMNARETIDNLLLRFSLWFSIIHLPKDVHICLWKVSYQQLLFKVPIPTWAHMHVFVSERHTESWAAASRRARIQVIVYFKVFFSSLFEFVFFFLCMHVILFFCFSSPHIRRFLSCAPKECPHKLQHNT